MADMNEKLNAIQASLKAFFDQMDTPELLAVIGIGVGVILLIIGIILLF